MKGCCFLERLKKIRLRTYDGYGEDKIFTDFPSANSFIRLYSFQSQGFSSPMETVGFTVWWNNGFSCDGNFPLPNTDCCTDDFLQQYIQDWLESALFFGIDFQKDIMKYLNSFDFLMDYVSYIPIQDQTYRMILLYGEGLNATAFLAHEKAFKETLECLFSINPSLKILNSIHEKYINLHAFYFHRTTVYKEYVDYRIRFLLAEIVDATMRGFLSEATEELEKIFTTLRQEQDCIDERFTSFGMELYQIFDNDRNFFPALQSPLSNDDANEILRRIEYLRFVSKPSLELDEQSLFYACYLSALNEIYQLPSAERNHYRVSVQTAMRLKSYQMTNAAILDCISAYDPFAVCLPSLGEQLIMNLH